MSYIISVLLFSLFCIIALGIFYLIIKIQEKKFKRYINENTLEVINDINNSTKKVKT